MLNELSLIIRRRKQYLLNTILKVRADAALLQETKLTPVHVEHVTKFLVRLFEIREF